MAQKEIIFVTGNAEKLTIANTIGKPFGVVFQQYRLDIDEIQSEDIEKIARDKANKAYRQVGSPIVINDDSWIIPGLGGFPGPYMKSMGQWLSSEDFLRLTKPLADRRIVLAQRTIYQDKQSQRLFQQDIEGILLPEIRGEHATSPMMSIVSFDAGAHSVAEHFMQAQAAINQRHTSWHDLCKWYSETHAN